METVLVLLINIFTTLVKPQSIGMVMAYQRSDSGESWISNNDHKILVA